MIKQVTLNNEVINLLEVVQTTPNFLAIRVERINENGVSGKSYIECFDHSILN
jgi:hypothetical protein